LKSAIHDRYNVLFDFPEMHSMVGYGESILRLIANAELFKDSSPGSIAPPTLNHVGNGVGTALNDLLSDSFLAAGGAGNDILIAKSPRDLCV
jgi:hypothetical protein